jgi:Zn-dependent protease
MLGLDPSTLISRLIILLVSLTVHEFFHAWVAVSFGDETPRLDGRLTLNPLKHLDLMGSLLLVFAGFGWAKPVRVNPYELTRKSPSALMWVSLAGPFSNFLLAAFAAIPLRFHFVPWVMGTGKFFPSAAEFLFDFIWVNLALMLFNLLPLAPLDGQKIAAEVLPPSWARVLDKIAPFSPYILIFLVFIAPLLGFDFWGLVINPTLYKLFNVLVGTSL